MDTPGIPERVYELCKIVEKKPTKTRELKEKMEPDDLNNNSSYFSQYKSVATELRLISENDDIISLAVNPSEIKDMEAFKKYVIRKLSSFVEGPFFKTTKAYYDLGDSILFGKEQNIAQMASKLSSEDLTVDDKGLRGWRFWATFLGLGYVKGMMFLPNASEYLQLLIEQSKLEKNHLYTVNEFLDLLSPQIEMVTNLYDENKTISFGLSNALSTLESAKVIKLDNIMDTGEVWTMYQYIKILDNRVTHITVL